MNFKITLSLCLCLVLVQNITPLGSDYGPAPTSLVAPAVGLLGLAIMTNSPTCQKVGNFFNNNDAASMCALTTVLALAAMYIYKDNKKRFYEANQKINSYLAIKHRGDLIGSNRVDVIYDLIKQAPNGSVIWETELNFWRDQKKSWLPF